jgi:hypothetical protein
VPGGRNLDLLQDDRRIGRVAFGQETECMTAEPERT